MCSSIVKWGFEPLNSSGYASDVAYTRYELAVTISESELVSVNLSNPFVSQLWRTVLKLQNQLNIPVQCLTV